jgi:hypothetical protein
MNFLPKRCHLDRHCSTRRVRVQKSRWDGQGIHIRSEGSRRQQRFALPTDAPGIDRSRKDEACGRE